MANQAIDWAGAVPEAKPKEFTILPPGEYWFRVEARDFSTWKNGKLAGMPVCRLDLVVWNESVKGEARLNLTNCTDMAWRIRQFWACVGEAVPEHGEYMPPWGDILGRVGKCTVKNGEFTGRDGKDYVTNDIDKLLPPQGTPPPVPGDAETLDDDDTPF